LQSSPSEVLSPYRSNIICYTGRTLALWQFLIASIESTPLLDPPRGLHNFCKQENCTSCGHLREMFEDSGRGRVADWASQSGENLSSFFARNVDTRSSWLVALCEMFVRTFVRYAGN
jgi:hypothetical protein